MASSTNAIAKGAAQQAEDVEECTQITTELIQEVDFVSNATDKMYCLLMPL